MNKPIRIPINELGHSQKEADTKYYKAKTFIEAAFQGTSRNKKRQLIHENTCIFLQPLN